MTALTSPRWIVTEVANPRRLDLWFSDGRAIQKVERGGSGTSFRLIMQTQGFLDITSLEIVTNALGEGRGPVTLFDFNNRRTLCPATTQVFLISLSLPGTGTFSATITLPGSEVRWTLSGSFKPFPVVSTDDAAYIANMIAKNYIPYPPVSGQPGQTEAEIRALGRRLFPWSPHSFELAMCVYDWTTASFTRMVFFKVFRYTSIPQTPTPLDLPSISLMIWESNWGSYNPQDVDFMRSFMMQPAHSQGEVSAQLAHVYPELYDFSDIQNRVLAAAIDSLPRTCIPTQPFLFSGQVDIYQMGMSRFGIGMLEFPGNAGPVGQALEVEFAAAAATFLRPGAVITTKMCWAFTDSEEAARHYSNGILLVAEPPEVLDSIVWDETAFVTELSNGPDKIEWVFPPHSRFVVLDITQASDLQVIRLRVLPPERAQKVEEEVESEAAEVIKETKSVLRTIIPPLDSLPRGEPPKIDHVDEKSTHGRWCRCVERHYGTVAQK